MAGAEGLRHSCWGIGAPGLYTVETELVGVYYSSESLLSPQPT